ncbi:MAG: hypothetical protein M3134_01250 [Actinomycetota bacterium]|nr:hypothetical protein [Actinomycetota bacterium]
MKKLVLGGVLAAAIAAAPASADAAIKPKPGTWTGKLDDTTYVELSVVKRGTRRLVRLSRYQDSIENGCVVSPVGEFLGTSGRALRVKSTGAFSGSFGSFSSTFGARTTEATGKFTSARRGRITVTASASDGDTTGCPKTTSFNLRRTSS